MNMVLLILIFISIVPTLNLQSRTTHTIDYYLNSENESIVVDRLMRSNSSVPESLEYGHLKPIGFIPTSHQYFTSSNQSTIFESSNFSDDDLIIPQTKIMAQFDVVIDEIYPKAIEINSSQTEYRLNFSIVDGQGLDSSIIINLTLRRSDNPLENYLITTWYNFWYKGEPSFDYSLFFTLNNSIISSLSFALYYFEIHTLVLTEESVSSINLPVKDLQVSILSLVPIEFNNKFDYNQTFEIQIEVKEFNGISYNPVTFLPRLLDSNSRLINPNVTILSSTDQTRVELYFFSFITNSSAEGTYTFNTTLLPDDARQFEEANHQLSVVVTSNDGIQAFNLELIQAKSTVLLVRLKKIYIESESFDWDILTNNGKEHKIFRININSSFLVTYEIYEQESGIIDDTAGDIISFQDPNKPKDPFAILQNVSSADGSDSIDLTSNRISLPEGYPLFLYVRGHRTSQEDELSNITIYWDSIDYNLNYYDDKGESGSKGLGLDIGATWALNLSLIYVSDSSPAYSSYIQYRYPSESPTWVDLIDGIGNDELDGQFSLNRTENNPIVLLLEIRVVNGSLRSVRETYFVDASYNTDLFSLVVTWTYLKIDLSSTEEDGRLGIGKSANINITVKWAHNESLPFSGYISARDWKNSFSLKQIVNGFGIWIGVTNNNPGLYQYRIDTIVDDPLFGVTKFFNISNGEDVSISLIWDSIEFTFSNTYNSSLDPSLQIWEASLEYTWSFFANINTNATLYIYGFHTYDNTPFQGVAELASTSPDGDIIVLYFNSKGIAIWTGDYTEFNIPIEFFINSIINSAENDWEIYEPGNPHFVEIVWDRLVVTLSANRAYSHGTWADIYISYSYAISPKSVNPSDVTYDFTLYNGTLTNVSLTHFRDFSLSPIERTYYLTNFFEATTGLLGADIQYRWTGYEPRLGNLTIYWIDDRQSRIIDRYIRDLGNGTILIIIHLTDNSEDWIGTGIQSVYLRDERENVLDQFPTPAEITEFSPGIYQCIFRYIFNQSDQSNGFRFSFNETLRFSLNITENEIPSFPEDLGKSRTYLSRVFTVQAKYDFILPKFIDQGGMIINITYLTNGTDGYILVKTMVQDEFWSGLGDNSVMLLITTLDDDLVFEGVMNPAQLIQPNLRRSILKFQTLVYLDVLKTYIFTVVATDISGNKNSYQIELVVEDRVAPRVIEFNSEKTDDRQLRVNVTLEENGLGIDFIRIRIRGYSIWYDLLPVGGSGADETAQRFIYSGLIPLILDLNNIIGFKVEFDVWTMDRLGNQKEFLLENYQFLLETIFLEPFVLGSLVFLLVIGIIIGIRVTSRHEGYDMQRIFKEGEQISREDILIQMDEFALGVTINFFDQIQGPVPVIWEPPLLEDQQQVMLDLSDKSFSTLEFVGTDEYERSGTFDFSTGSYECTALGYSFAIENPEARGGKENLTIVLLLRREWGENLLVFQDELVEKLRQIRILVENRKPASEIERTSRELREMVSRLMIAFNNLYLKQEKSNEKR